MSKLLMGFMVALVLMNVLSAFMDGGGGMVTTQLTENVATTDNHLDVTSTTGFLSAGIVMCEQEKIVYTATNTTAFLNITKGYEGTDNSTHNSGRKVFTEESSALNDALGFDAGAIATSNGALAIFIIPWNFITITLPKMILWRYSFFYNDASGLLSMLQYVLIAISMVVFVILAIQAYQFIKAK
jgi:hypothetical protein